MLRNLTIKPSSLSELIVMSETLARVRKALPPPPPKLPPPTPATTCPASNQDKLKKCMLQTIVTDECCLTFKTILMHSCPCYKYAEKFDDRTLSLSKLIAMLETLARVRK
ncbi:hypothetical protein P3L10_034539 [Capsicum annuum]|uniref:uncharacterized protein LOC107854419 n=1 Tax=Capsicum annuum TaxID=4072 RepID=UPI0007BEB53D|nr:uncharacterized protein LOC107854419 [Capsicum annuum]